MRKVRRFTPELLDKWEKSGRGTGIFTDYSPWHQITRGDPSSLGRSHLIYCPQTQRRHHLMSDGEKRLFGFALMVPDAIDFREQYMLSTGGHFAALSPYSKIAFPSFEQSYLHKGTFGIAGELGIKHAWWNRKSLWRQSTDMLITIASEDEGMHLLALAYKPGGVLNNRQRDLLRIEREYWMQEGVRWQLITPDIYNRDIGATVTQALPWILHPDFQFDINEQDACAYFVNRREGYPLTDLIRSISQRFDMNDQAAKAMFWQAVWTGRIPMDLCRPHFIKSPVTFLDPDEFWKQNPITARRSAWL